MKKRTLNIQMAGESNRGLRRSRNEDSFLVCRPGTAYAFACVADGIGSHSDGQLASMICCRDFLNAALRYDFENGNPELFLKENCGEINRKIFDRNYREFRNRPMGCTAVAAVFAREYVVIGNVGDSRFYEFLPGREQPLQQITIDHHPDDETLEMLSARYNINKESLKVRILLHSIGIRHRAKPDIFRLKTVPGAIYLLCSDGLSGMVSEVRIAEIVDQYQDDMRKLTSALMREALICGGKDNVTVVSVKYDGVDHAFA